MSVYQSNCLPCWLMWLVYHYTLAAFHGPWLLGVERDEEKHEGGQNDV